MEEKRMGKAMSRGKSRIDGKYGGKQWVEGRGG